MKTKLQKAPTYSQQLGSKTSCIWRTQIRKPSGMTNWRKTIPYHNNWMNNYKIIDVKSKLYITTVIFIICIHLKFCLLQEVSNQSCAPFNFLQPETFLSNWCKNITGKEKEDDLVQEFCQCRDFGLYNPQTLWMSEHPMICLINIEIKIRHPSSHTRVTSDQSTILSFQVPIRFRFVLMNNALSNKFGPFSVSKVIESWPSPSFFVYKKT